MLATIFSAVLLGICAGLAPGPYTTMVVMTAVERDFQTALRLALTPLLTDIAPLIVTAIVLDQLSPRALTIVGVFGGLIIGSIGVRFLLSHSGRAADEVTTQSAKFWHVVAGTFLSPAPWLFWLILGSPLMLVAWARSPQQGVLFAVLLFATNIGSASTLAWTASRGARLMSPAFRHRALRYAGIGLTLVGAYLVWQAATGNFQGMIDRQENFRTFIDETTSGGG